ncbi:MAG: NUDIX domain-containing protein [Acidobacteria bacterium]|nr:NUDIX domain-containing protein [Acidobacteriota bacterium]
MTKSGIEFLLVRTRKGRWIFPKGGLEPGLTRAQSAALEAFEEAGVHGRIEEDSFFQYTLHKRRVRAGARRGDVRTHAHLCEVLRITQPQESRREPTWYSPTKAKRHLQKDRGRETGIELASVIDRAQIRIERLRASGAEYVDPLQRVSFEAPQAAMRLLSRSPRLMGAHPSSSNLTLMNRRRGKILLLGPGRGEA